jgi:hypothetical protein
MDRALPVVDLKVFRQAYDVWYAAITKAPREESCMAGFAAVREIIDDDDQYVCISWRLNMLRDLISIPFIEQVRAHSGFPDEWLDVAATAPFNRMEPFAIEHFKWPSGEGARP